MMNSKTKLCSGAWFLTAALFTPCVLASPPTQPGAPEGRIQGSTASLSWKESFDDNSVQGYNVYLNDQYIATVSEPSYVGEIDTTIDNVFYVVSFDEPMPGSEQARQFSQPSDALVLQKYLDTTDRPQDLSPTLPAIPMVDAVSSSSISISWAPSQDDVGVVGYNVYRDNAYHATVFDTVYTDEALPDAESVSYSIVAFDRVPNFTPQGEAVRVDIPIGDTGEEDLEPPTVPESLSLVEASADFVSIEWASSVDNISVSGYNVYRNGDYLATVRGTTSFTDAEPPVGNTVSYAIVAFDDASNFTVLSDALTVSLSGTPE